MPYKISKTQIIQSFHPLTPKQHLPLKIALLQRPHHPIADGAERKRQREADVAAVPGADEAADGPDEPHLRHAHDGAHDAEAEGHDGGDARWQPGGVAVDGDVVAGEAALEEEVLGQGDAFVDGEPVAL